MRARDTSPEARAVQLAAIGQMTGAQRVELALQMSDELLQVSRAGIRSRHPELDEAGVTRELHRLLGHTELAR